MKIPYFCCIGAELKRYAQDFDFMNQVYLYKVPTDDSIDEVLSEDYFKAISNSVLQDDIVYIYEASAETLHECRFDKQNGHITAVPLVSDETLTGAVTSIIHDNLTPNKLLKSDENGKVAASDFGENDFVKVDGSSIMTGPLKFRAGSMRGAVAPYLNGVSFWKMDSQENITNIANLTDSQFLPVTTNSIDLGNTTHTWKDAHVARVITSVLNNGYDIAVPVTNSADTLALKSQVDLAANSGSQLYTTGVWYAKMYSASTVPTGAEYDGRNYADFSQVDNDNNPIIVIYEGQSGAWVETDRITPPAEYNGYVTITSKIWDIAEQTDQQGGEVLWSYNQKTFTPYPKIVSLLNQANTDLSNLSSIGQNIGNWSSNVSKCITEIPQDIKLELNNGTLTLKAGSKYYYPNGAGVFEIRTVPTDTTLTQGWGAPQTFLLFVRSDGSLGIYDTARCYSGTSSVSDGAYYNTNDNKVYVYNGGSLDYQASLPIAKITGQSPTITSIDQVFNGRGYIGSTVFALPSVKGLIPDGRNADGTLKSVPFAVSAVRTFGYNLTGKFCVIVTQNDMVYVGSAGWKYNASANINTDYGTKKLATKLADVTLNSGVITSFEPVQAFHAVDYNDFATLETSKANTSLDNVSSGIDFVVESQLPTAQNNYTWYRKYKSGWVEQGGTYKPTSEINVDTVNIPIEMADTNYNIQVTIIDDTSSVAPTYAAVGARTKGTTSFTTYGSPHLQKDWLISGMAAS